MTASDASAEDVARRLTTNLALLIRFAQAEQRGERGATNAELDADAWYAIETILLTARRDVERLEEILLEGGPR